MKRVILYFCLLVPVALGIGLIGCSDDDDGPTNNQLLVGDTTAPEFQFVRAMFDDQALAGVGQALNLTFDFWDSIPGATMAGGRGFADQSAQEGEDLIISSYDYQYSGGWHVFSFEAIITDGIDTVDVNGLDSVQFILNNEPTQVPDSNVTDVYARATINVGVTLAQAAANIGAMSGAYSLHISGLTPSMATPVTIDGSGEESIEFAFSDDTTSCDFSMTQAFDIDNVETAFEAECPLSGGIAIAATLDLSCTQEGPDQLDVNGAWTYAVTFAGASATATFSDGTTVWTVTEACDEGGGVAKRIARAF